jgi:hypothetical protein
MFYLLHKFRKSKDMSTMNLLDALAKLLNCEIVALHDYLNHPSANNKVQEFLKEKKLRTSYRNRSGVQDPIKFGFIGLKNSIEQHAYEGFLGISYLLYT